MTYSKFESSLDATDRKVKKIYEDNDSDAMTNLAWRLGYKGEQFFSKYSQDLISEMGLCSLVGSSYREGMSDLNY
tara:strand:- start:3964 stop:4188 length:225 start_codon:yes stop_codon:yes gene_type:complete